ncbi:hypothetical protein FGL91_18715 [Microbacterium sp. CBA3102]|uniref:hypothetical protein n=1 Tax=Microbacterium sp. CBA3102 TaxID=2603598 RepID=UPI0011BB1BF9|nr:hypothetical protein [Microbacterium sp. CBA3102]QEA30401.1 hypothetical protein FGL91_18715 [Microbacterium sp. CBA3102]
MPSARKNLRAVGEDETPPAKLTVAQAAASGDHRSLLVSMRERIALTVTNPDCPPRDLAALTRRLQDISKEIEALDLRAKEDGADANDVVEDESWDAATI